MLIRQLTVNRIFPGFSGRATFFAKHLPRGILTAIFCSSLMGVASAASFVVTSVADNADAALDGICADAVGQCTLRAAMQEAVYAGGVNSITFNIPAGLLVAGVVEIVLSTGPLPLLTGANLQLT